MSEQKKEGLSHLASMLELYTQEEVSKLTQEMTSALPPSCRDALSLIAKVSKIIVNPNLVLHIVQINILEDM